MTTTVAPRRVSPRPPFEIREAFWGYVIRPTEGPPILLQVAQGVVLACGAAFTAGALVLVLLPGSGDAAGLGPMRTGLSTVLAALALLLLWFATRGGVVELQVDLTQGELREIVRHRLGRATVLSRHGLDAAASLVIDRSGPASAPKSLILRLAGGPDLVIARGPEALLATLRRRLERDLMLSRHTILPPARGGA